MSAPAYKNNGKPLMIPDHLGKAWLKRLSDDELWQVYHHFRSVDDYLSYGTATRLNSKLLRVRGIMEERKLL